jgi:hypothetical protein
MNEEIKKICVLIGCSGVDPKMCNDTPHLCKIIRRLVKR